MNEKTQEKKQIVKISFAITDDQQQRLNKFREMRILNLSSMFRDSLDRVMDEYEDIHCKLKNK